MNNQITVNLGEKSYNIIIGAGKIDFLPQFLAKNNYSKIFIITDENVAKLHLSKLTAQLSERSFFTTTIANGEQSKNFSTFEKICEEILQQGIDRKSLIIAFGGGVVGDLAGFAASVLLRGVDFIQIPTTLLACVDSSVGGKTAINSKAGKNLIGSFYQPKLVICDSNFLKTLPSREFFAGYAEALKYGLIEDKEFFNFLDENVAKIQNRDEKIIEKIIIKSCEVKARIVGQDEKENGVRALLNFGHTFGHTFEIETNYSSQLLHGEAVAIGMLMAAKMSQSLELIDAAQFEIIKNHLIKCGLNIDLKKIKAAWNKENLVKHLYKDKKTEHKNLTFILLNKIGEAFIHKGATAEDFLRIVAEFI